MTVFCDREPAVTHSSPLPPTPRERGYRLTLPRYADLPNAVTIMDCYISRERGLVSGYCGALLL